MSIRTSLTVVAVTAVVALGLGCAAASAQERADPPLPEPRDARDARDAEAHERDLMAARNQMEQAHAAVQRAREELALHEASTEERVSAGEAQLAAARARLTELEALHENGSVSEAKLRDARVAMKGLRAELAETHSKAMRAFNALQEQAAAQEQALHHAREAMEQVRRRQFDGEWPERVVPGPRRSRWSRSDSGPRAGGPRADRREPDLTQRVAELEGVVRELQALVREHGIGDARRERAWREVETRRRGHGAVSGELRDRDPREGDSRLRGERRGGFRGGAGGGVSLGGNADQPFTRGTPPSESGALRTQIDELRAALERSMQENAELRERAVAREQARTEIDRGRREMAEKDELIQDLRERIRELQETR